MPSHSNPLPQPRGRRRHRFSDAWLALVVAAGVILVQIASQFFTGLELKLYDAASTRTDRLPSDRIAIIAIDDTSIANIGRWPWPREVQARMIDLLSAAGAKTIANTSLFLEPQTDRGLESLRALRDELNSAPAAPGLADLGPAARQHLLGYIGEAEQQLDSDAQLEASLLASGRVVIPSLFTLGEPLGRPDVPLPDFALRSTLPGAPDMGLPAMGTQQPLAGLGSAAQAVAHLKPSLAADGAVRSEPLLVRYDGHTVPSMALAVAAISLNLAREDLKVLPGEGLMLGKTRVGTDELGRVLPQFYPSKGDKPAFATDAFYDVLAGKISPDKYRDKIVIIGATAAGVGSHFNTPVAAGLSPAEILAHTTSSLMQNHFIAEPVWSRGAVLLVLALLIAYLALVLPRLSAGTGAGVSMLLFLGLLGTDALLLSKAATWVPLVFPAALLLIGHLALVTRRFGATESRQLSSDAESAETNRQMGLSLQGQGQLDLAFDRLRRVPHSEALMDNLQSLALDFERKRQFNKAEAVYAHMLRLDSANADVKQRLSRAATLAQTVMLGSGAAQPGGTLILGGEGVEKPMLGRYQVEKELGKGAMGVVYQGRDPKIGRVVAIKTLALSAEFEGSELQDARERFFREAETAGRLQHPHIVTIFDAGEEHDLAFIAMEFLRGQDLVAHARAGQLLPVSTVLSIGERVALALDYAHRHQVVHRDIKPANIMYDAATDAVKVTDFGIARITDASRTKTGTILGTPSFMSPEQLSGRVIDGRSDLYSLGVTLYQLLTGSLPFRGDSLSALMFDIANKPPLDPRQIRADLPVCVADILQRSLEKAPEARYLSGEDLAKALRRAASSLPATLEAAGAATGSGRGDPFEATLVQPPGTMAPNNSGHVAT